jgi:hypothetical protein
MSYESGCGTLDLWPDGSDDEHIAEAAVERTPEEALPMAVPLHHERQQRAER